MDDDSDDPRPVRPPAAPLPRITRFSLPPEDDAPEPKPKPKPKPKAKKKKRDNSSKKPGDGREDGTEKSGILIEETPELDTYDTRRKIRIGVGVGALAVICLATYAFVSPWLRSEKPPEDVSSDQPFAAVPNQAAPRNIEFESRVALNDARDAAKRGDVEKTLSRLHKIIEDYPKTPAAHEAEEALKRGDQGLPLFVDVPLVFGKAAPKQPEPEPPPTAVVNAEPVRPTVTPGKADADVAPPPTPPEPQMKTGLINVVAKVPPRSLRPGFRARPDLGVHESGWPWEITCDRDGAAMVLIPGGTFKMGDDSGPPAERPEHQVQLPPYYIDQHEITVRQYNLFLAASPQAAGGKAAKPRGDGEDLPITNVSWRDATSYAEWAGKALPTEAQWELAGRTIDSRLHPWGKGPPEWDQPREPKQIDRVMSFARDMSPYGVFDLAGNASEWTADIFGAKYYEQFKGKVAVNPPGPLRDRKHQNMTIKGGSSDWELPWRSEMSPESRSDHVGFRCVLSVEDTAASVVPTPSGQPGGAPAGAGPRPF